MLMIIFTLGIFIGYSAQEEDVRQAFIFSELSDEKPLSPSNQVSAEQIKAYSDKVVIELDNPVWARIKDTKSMEPVLNNNSVSIETKP